MSAFEIRVEWRLHRAIVALKYDTDIDMSLFAADFELSIDETYDLFVEAANSLNMEMEPIVAHMLH